MSNSSNVPNVLLDQAPEVDDPEGQYPYPAIPTKADLSLPDPADLTQLYQPMLPAGDQSSSDDPLTLMQRAISQIYLSTANLAKRLPTGTVLAFQLLSPVFTDAGQCSDQDRNLTSCLLAVCALSCFLLSFTDSFKDGSGRLRYGFATTKGLYMIDGMSPPPPEAVTVYKLTIIDFIHGFTTMLVFAAVALLDHNVVMCFSPEPTRDIQRLFMVLPMGIGVIGSAMVVIFPNKRHGIGFPIAQAG